MKTVILGNGYLGNIFLERLENCVLRRDYIENIKHVKDIIDEERPDVIINTIGKTGINNIDWCENNADETYYSNIVVPALIAKACKDYDVKMVHLSTGCFFTGYDKEWTEKDLPNYVENVYTRSKLLGEEIVNLYGALILRIRMPVDYVSHRRNLVDKLIKYDKIIVCLNSITIIDDLVYAVKELLKQNASGIFHVVNPQPVTHVDIINKFRNKVFFDIKSYIKPSELTTQAGRSNCMLSTEKLNSFGIFLTPTEEALERCALQYEKS